MKEGKIMPKSMPAITVDVEGGEDLDAQQIDWLAQFFTGLMAEKGGEPT
ncbi:hypothetical protein [Caproicibacterium sp. XB1]